MPVAGMEMVPAQPSQVTSDHTSDSRFAKGVNEFLPNQSLPFCRATGPLLTRVQTSWLVLEPFSHIPLCFGSRSCKPLLARGLGYLVHLEVLVFLIRSV